MWLLDKPWRQLVFVSVLQISFGVEQTNPSPPAADECGVVAAADGHQSQHPKQWPFHVGLYRIVAGSGDSLYFCGATIVSRWFVVGSAHCVLNYAPEMLSVRYATYDLTQPEQGGKVGVSRVLLHPEYRAQNFSHDIALLELSSGLTFDETTVRPACLWPTVPGETVSVGDQLEGTVGTSVGWGIGPHNLYTYVLLILEVSASTKRKCIESFDERLFTGDQFFCAVTPVCKGSGGSGFYVKVGDRYYLRGITTFGIAAKGKYQCGVNTLTSLLNVAHYTDWIQQQLADHHSHSQLPEPEMPEQQTEQAMVQQQQQQPQ
ncbi:ovochymase-2-like [Anopheles darlingi]|uniref:ovochymase-2-like n=1 Tax=Anopheles darlingi TaxID=43151 RepID=UPI0021005778|nr:ovochymase-2-like [Anopheles darlingi]